ncbi:MAG: N-acyl-D-aspartate/D-glutamate deacylase, partial [Halioglobus sp.]
MSDSSWDTLIREALVFDGTGGPPETLDIALKDGR